MHLIIGKDKEEVRRSLHSLLKDCLGSTTSFYPDQFSVATFSQEVETLPFLEKHKILILHDVDQLTDGGIEAICRYLQKPNGWMTLFLTASELSLQSKIAKLVGKHGKVLHLKEEKPWEKERKLADWLIGEAKEGGFRLSMQAAMALVQGIDHQMLRVELDKLICFAYGRQEITLEDISMVSMCVHHETIWQLGDAIMGRESARALTIGSSLLEEGMSIFLLLASLRSQFLTGIEIFLAVEQGEVAKRFPYLKGNFLDKKLHLLKKFGRERLREGALLLFETEVRAKNSSIDPQLLLEILIIKLYQENYDTLSFPQFARACC